jgi:RNA polymerase sigma-70 factor (ECF subfamily)
LPEVSVVSSIIRAVRRHSIRKTGPVLVSDRPHLEGDEASAAPGAVTTSEVFQVYAHYAWRALRRLGVPASDVEDVCQEVFVTVHRRLPSFEGRSSVLSWVYGICVKVAADHRKRARTHRRKMAALAAEPTGLDEKDDPVAIRQARARLDAILDALEDSKRAVFVLYEIEELSMSDVAAAVGCPVQTAYSRLHAARTEVAAAIARTSKKERSYE